MTRNNSNRPAGEPAARRAWRRFLVPRFIALEVAIWRELGLRGYVRKRGFRFFAAIFIYYLVRDTTLYIIIPYLLLKGVISCPGPGAGP